MVQLSFHELGMVIKSDGQSIALVKRSGKGVEKERKERKRRGRSGKGEEGAEKERKERKKKKKGVNNSSQ